MALFEISYADIAAAQEHRKAFCSQYEHVMAQCSSNKFCYRRTSVAATIEGLRPACSRKTDSRKRRSKQIRFPKFKKAKTGAALSKLIQKLSVEDHSDSNSRQLGIRR